MCPRHQRLGRQERWWSFAVHPSFVTADDPQQEMCRHQENLDAPSQQSRDRILQQSYSSVLVRVYDQPAPHSSAVLTQQELDYQNPSVHRQCHRWKQDQQSQQR